MNKKAEEFEKRFNNLNPKQREAVESIQGPVLVIAGPGSGKTELLAIRTANILKETDILPQNILLLTFTDSASFNMRERLVKLIGESAYRICIFTFHSFASDLLNKYPEYFFAGARFKPATEIDQINIVESILKSLPRSNPFGSFHPELGHVYLRDCISSIRDLKKGGFTPDKFKDKLAQNNKDLKELKNIFNELEDVAGKRKYMEVLPVYLDIYNKLAAISSLNQIAKILETSLGFAIEKSRQEEKTPPLTAWKTSFSKKTESGKIILKDADPDRIEKLESLLGVYSQYQEELYKKGLFDFEDMIIMALNALQNNGNLKAELQEKYQYVMIDEFQDTNDSQFQLIKELVDSPVNFGQPNVFAVGDPRQAIFKFQGAVANNLDKFYESFTNTKRIILDQNYRSTQEILNFSQEVIDKSEETLNILRTKKGKGLVAAGESKKGDIKIKEFKSEIHEFEYIAKELQKLLKEGVEAKEIAIICRKHEQLKNLSDFLNSYKIPYTYSKRENVLQMQHIKELTTILKFLYLRAEGNGEELLPEILSYNFWGLNRIEVWKIAEAVRTERSTWLAGMHNSKNSKIHNIANFLINLSVKSKSTPIEYVLDEIIGTTEYLWDDTEHDDTLIPIKNPAKDFISPFKKYYFNGQIFNHNSTAYLEFLFSLRTLIGALREFHTHKILYAKDIFEFLEVYNGNHLTLSIVSPFSSSENAVALHTAHSSKGLEFEYVFLLSADNEVWTRGNSGGRIPFPINMNLSPESENDDDKIRLLYVALTRAKHSLYITHSKPKVGYLGDISENYLVGGDESGELLNSKELVESLELVKPKPFLEDENLLLKRLLESYKMPVTHLNNYLNFLRVGPTHFIEQSILRFPQAVTPSGAYGTAMHASVERFYTHLQKHNEKLSLLQMQQTFQNYLESARLGEQDYKKFLQSGNENLKIYRKFLEKRIFLPNTKVETRFVSEEVVIGECAITGTIDRMELVDSLEIVLTDLKTGEAYNTFEEKGLADYEKIKLHFYKYQLAFYALLIENSRSFNGYKVKVGNIEFVEAKEGWDGKKEIIILPFEIDQQIKDRVVKLANIVCAKIHKLDFPDTSHYPQNYKGILQFEEDLLDGKI